MRMQVLTGREYEKNGEKKVAWTIIGSAWPAKSGEGWDITLDALPVSGKMILRPPKERSDNAYREAAQPVTRDTDSREGMSPGPGYSDGSDDLIPF